VPARPSTTSTGSTQVLPGPNLLQQPGLFGINRNGCSASAETTVRLHPKQVYDFGRNCETAELALELVKVEP
jgi:hypothetical protein